MTKKNLSYWELRKLQYEQASFQKSKEFIKWLNGEYNSSLDEINRDIFKDLTKIAEDNQLSISEAKKLLNDNELKDFKMSLENFSKKAQGELSKEVETMLNNASNRYHISRLQAMEIQIKAQVDRLLNIEQKNLFNHLGEAYKDRFYRMTYDLQTIKGYDFIEGINERKLNEILNKPWVADGKNFSERIWGRNEKITSELHKELTQNILRGKTSEETIKAISKKFETSRNNAERLVYTESASITAIADEESYRETGVEKYEITATLDYKTSNICRDLDGKIFKISEYKVGITAPPFHVRCRTTTVPYFDDFLEDETRAMRNPITGKAEIVKKMDYKEWHNKYIVSDKQAAKQEQIHKNRFQDKKQYKNYKKILGKNMPFNFDDFKELKYNNSNRWSRFKDYKNAITSGELTALADFKLYEKIDKEIDKKLIGQIADNGLKVKSKSKHFINRVIGSVEQKRSGVEIDDILEALSNPKKIHPVMGIKMRSQRFDSEICRVAINPDTGSLIQVNPLSTKR